MKVSKKYRKLPTEGVTQMQMNWVDESRTFTRIAAKRCPVHWCCPSLHKSFDIRSKRNFYYLTCDGPDDEPQDCAFNQTTLFENLHQARRLWNLAIILSHDP